MRKKIILVLVIINGLIKLAHAQTDSTMHAVIPHTYETIIEKQSTLKFEILLTLDKDIKVFRDAVSYGNASNAYLLHMIAIKNEHDSVYQKIMCMTQLNYDCLTKHRDYEDSVNTKMYQLEEISFDISNDDRFEGWFQDKTRILSDIIEEFKEMEKVHAQQTKEWSEMTNAQIMNRKR